MRPATTMRHHPLTPNRLWLALTLWGLLFVGLVYGGSLALAAGRDHQQRGSPVQGLAGGAGPLAK
ncbi:MAG: hypothetical protein KDE56_29260, partial [Anaerolineales bacterium]|nr:hypothetical protein [Anaerolineales bacterium]